MDGGKKTMRGLIVIIAIICLFMPGCSIYTGKPSQWDYYTPEHVKCYDKQTKMCRQYGAHLICECVA